MFLWFLLGRFVQISVMGIYSTAFKPFEVESKLYSYRQEIVDLRVLQEIIFMDL
jgi:hypothetical protein